MRPSGDTTAIGSQLPHRENLRPVLDTVQIDNKSCVFFYYYYRLVTYLALGLQWTEITVIDRVSVN